MRRRVRVVCFIRMRQHAVDESGVDRAAQDVRADHRSRFLRVVGAGELDGDLRRRQLDARDHRGHCVENVMLCFLGRVGRQLASPRLAHVRAERRHHAGSVLARRRLVRLGSQPTASRRRRRDDPTRTLEQVTTSESIVGIHEAFSQKMTFKASCTCRAVVCVPVIWPAVAIGAPF